MLSFIQNSMNNLSFRKATKSDCDLYFKWVNDSFVREQSYNSKIVSLEEHQNWFLNKIIDVDWHFYLFENLEKEKVGQVRIQKINELEAVIGVSVDALNRGKGYGITMLQLATIHFLNSCPDTLINAYIKVENLASKTTFEKAGFDFKELMVYHNFKSYHYIKYANRKI